jgi:hypothetical protein
MAQMIRDYGSARRVLLAYYRQNRMQEINLRAYHGPPSQPVEFHVDSPPYFSGVTGEVVSHTIADGMEVGPRSLKCESLKKPLAPQRETVPSGGLKADFYAVLSDRTVG